MNGTEIFEKLNDLDPELIESEPKAKGQRHIGGRRIAWIAAAACLVFILGGTTAYAARHIMEAKRTENENEVGYSFTTQLGAAEQSELKGEIREAPAIIREQWKNYSMLSSQHPGHYSRRFETAADAMAYIGYDGLEMPWFPYDISEVFVYVDADREGNFQDVMMETGNYTASVRAQLGAMIRFGISGDFESGSVWNKDDIDDYEMSSSEFTAKNGLVCHTVDGSAGKMGYKTLDGFIIKNNVLYTFHAAFQPEEQEQAETMLHTWADSFAPEK